VGNFGIGERSRQRRHFPRRIGERKPTFVSFTRIDTGGGRKGETLFPRKREKRGGCTECRTQLKITDRKATGANVTEGEVLRADPPKGEKSERTTTKGERKTRVSFGNWILGGPLSHWQRTVQEEGREALGGRRRDGS